MKSETFNLVAKIWRDVAHDKLPSGDIESYFESHEPRLFDIGNFFYTIFSPGKLELDFCSPSIETCLGYKKEEVNTKFFWSHIHPADIEGILTLEEKKLQFYNSLPPSKIEKYKVTYSFRMKNRSGKYINLLYQSFPVEVDKDGAVLRVIAAFTDITFFKRNPDMCLSYIGLSGEPDRVNVKCYSPVVQDDSPFSKRETEVLKLLARRFSNHEIADKLNISSVTVSNHRKKMLRKTKAGSTLNLILLAIDKGWV